MYREKEILFIRNLEYSQGEVDMLFDQRPMREFFFDLQSNEFFLEKVDFFFRSIVAKKEEIYDFVLFSLYEDKNGIISEELREMLEDQYLKQILMFEMLGELRGILLQSAILNLVIYPSLTLKQSASRAVREICCFNKNWANELLESYFDEISEDSYFIEKMTSKIGNYLIETLSDGEVDYNITFFEISYCFNEGNDPLKSRELDFAYNELITNTDIFPKVKEVLEYVKNEEGVYKEVYHFVKEECFRIAIEIVMDNPNKYTFNQAIKLAVNRFMMDLKQPINCLIFQKELVQALSYF